MSQKKKGWFGKLIDFNIDEAPEEKLEVKGTKPAPQETEKSSQANTKTNMKRPNVINFEDKKYNIEQLDDKDYQMVFYKPYEFHDCVKIGDWIAKDVIVVLNLEDMDIKVAQRIVDFVSGSLYVKGARLMEIGKSVQLCIPAKVNVKIDDIKFSEHKSNYGDRMDVDIAEEIRPKYTND